MTPLFTDRYTKVVLTVIAAALVALTLRPWLGTKADWSVENRAAEAQTPAPPGAPAAPAAPEGAPVAIPSANPAFNQPWWDDCAIVSKETVPVSWGRLVGLAPGAFLFESDDLIRLVRVAPYEAVAYDPSKKPCKILEIKKTK
jgi:hypothetical protein